MSYYHFLCCTVNWFVRNWSDGVVCFCFEYGIILFFNRVTEHLPLYLTYHAVILFSYMHTLCYVNFNYNWIKVLRQCSMSCVRTFLHCTLYNVQVCKHELFRIYTNIQDLFRRASQTKVCVYELRASIFESKIWWSCSSVESLVVV